MNEANILHTKPKGAQDDNRARMQEKDKKDQTKLDKANDKAAKASANGQKVKVKAKKELVFGDAGGKVKKAAKPKDAGTITAKAKEEAKAAEKEAKKLARKKGKADATAREKALR